MLLVNNLINTPKDELRSQASNYIIRNEGILRAVCVSLLVFVNVFVMQDVAISVNTE